MIKTILLWWVFINFILGIIYHLYNVAEGEHEHEETPLPHAVAAVYAAIMAILWWFFVLI